MSHRPVTGVSITVRTESSAFGDDDGEMAVELGRILAELTSYVYSLEDMSPLDGKTLRDANGNRVGAVTVIR